jgi:hypothetical protein
MQRSDIGAIVHGIADTNGLECKFPLEVFGSKDLGVRYRNMKGRVGDLIPKASFAVSEEDTVEQITEKADTAVACLKLNIQTGWNRLPLPQAVLDMKAET